ncbi:MAG: hypothetical protein KGY41_07045, partial [Desulfovermiculus sp.]|nr:hypothetical protein [Desulfovermiculus sp.]
MIHFRILTKNEKYFALAFVLGFILKYNYLCLVIYQAPLILPLLLKNIIIFLFSYFFILPLLKNKAGRYTLFFFLLFYTLFFLANVWYNRYFGNYLSLSDMLMGQGVRPFSVLIKQLIKFYDFIFVFDLIIAGLYVSKEQISYKLKYIFSYLVHFKIKHPIFIILFLLAFQILGTNHFLGKEKPTTLFNQSTSAFVNVYGILPLYFFEFLSFYQSENINEQDSPPATAAENLIDEEVIKDKIKISNIIVIQLESLDRKIIGYEHKGIPITPFLNELKKKSLFFDNFYAQHINGSFDAEFSFLT